MWMWRKEVDVEEEIDVCVEEGNDVCGGRK